jgi:hypothetical protein
MKTSIKFNFIVILLLPIISAGLLYASSSYLDSILSGFPNSETYQIIEKVQDIDKLKKLHIVTLETLTHNNENFVEIHYNYLTVFLAFIIINTMSLVSIYKHCKNNVSNKASNCDRAKSRASS